MHPVYESKLTNSSKHQELTQQGRSMSQRNWSLKIVAHETLPVETTLWTSQRRIFERCLLLNLKCKFSAECWLYTFLEQPKIGA
jgi:hypothetical protein